MVELVETYADFPLGTTDAAVMALAERLGLTEIASTDHRHFRAVRPRYVHAASVSHMPSCAGRDATKSSFCPMAPVVAARRGGMKAGDRFDFSLVGSSGSRRRNRVPTTSRAMGSARFLSWHWPPSLTARSPGWDEDSDWLSRGRYQAPPSAK
jgi:hypothetical protein